MNDVNTGIVMVPGSPEILDALAQRSAAEKK